MAWKIFSIGKANDEITRLETELAARDKRITELEAGLKSAGENDGAVAEAATKLRAELDTATAQIKALEVERDQLKKDIETEKSSVAKKAADKALEITANQGQVPIKTGETGAGGANGSDIIAQYNAIKDPRERTAFYRKNKAAYDAAFAAQKK